MQRPRIPPLDPPYDPELAAELARFMPPGIPPLRLFRTLAHNPRVLRKFRLGSLLDHGSIERRDREIVILRTCARCGSEYEWGVHVAVFAARCGLTQAEVAASLRTGTDDALWSPRDRLLVRLADELHDFASISEALWVELARCFRADQLIELLVLAGFYHTVSFVTNAIQIELEEAAPRFG
ncbi:MAG TPA: carboxymuconolactone decarboxylase family protein [Myxococcota bacterium]|nr:carboxymuconolactone decarboxylase family protein [Myxococcota bacterium]